MTDNKLSKIFKTYVLWRVLFIIPLRYLFAIGLHCILLY